MYCVVRFLLISVSNALHFTYFRSSARLPNPIPEGSDTDRPQPPRTVSSTPLTASRFRMRRRSTTTFRRIPSNSPAVSSRHSGESLCTIHTSSRARALAVSMPALRDSVRHAAGEGFIWLYGVPYSRAAKAQDDPPARRRGLAAVPGRGHAIDGAPVSQRGSRETPGSGGPGRVRPCPGGRVPSGGRGIPFPPGGRTDAAQDSTKHGRVDSRGTG